ncbi:MAG: hypothetical protein ACODAC_01845 [Pseudomonadota bacterium]
MDRLRGYENVDHVLGVLVEMHERLGEVIGELAGRAGGERDRMALRYLAEHQSGRAAALADYRRDADPTLLKQWLQIPFPEEPGDLIDALGSRGDDASVESLVTEIDGFMDRLLHHLRDRAETDNARALFRDLLDIEDRERHSRSRALASFAQI